MLCVPPTALADSFSSCPLLHQVGFLSACQQPSSSASLPVASRRHGVRIWVQSVQSCVACNCRPPPPWSWPPAYLKGPLSLSLCAKCGFSILCLVRYSHQAPSIQFVLRPQLKACLSTALRIIDAAYTKTTEYPHTLSLTHPHLPVSYCVWSASPYESTASRPQSIPSIVSHCRCGFPLGYPQPCRRQSPAPPRPRSQLHESCGGSAIS